MTADPWADEPATTDPTPNVGNDDSFDPDENLVADLGLADVPDGLNGTYPAHITMARAVKGTKKDPNARAFSFKYKVDMPGDKLDGYNQDHFLPANGENDKLFLQQQLKEHMKSLGLDLNSITRSDLKNLEGKPVWIKVQKSGTYRNVTAIKPRPEGRIDPFASEEVAPATNADADF